MKNFDDFALPSLENIEQMAKAYKDYELKEKEKKNFATSLFSKEEAQILFYHISKIAVISKFLFSNHKNSDQAKSLFEKSNKIKLIVDGMLIDFNLEEIKNFSLAENTAIQDICACCSKSLRICLNKIQNNEIATISKDLLSVIEIICEY